MPQPDESSIEFALTCAEATETLGSALAHAFPGAPAAPVQVLRSSGMQTLASSQVKPTAQSAGDLQATVVGAPA